MIRELTYKTNFQFFKYPRIIYQPGRVIQSSLSSASDRMYESSGEDITELGQWFWTRYMGNNGMMLRVVTSYLSCVPLNIVVNSTYTHQKQHFTSHNDI